LVYALRDCRNPSPLAETIKLAKQANSTDSLKHLQTCIPCREHTLARESELSGSNFPAEELDEMLIEAITCMDQKQEQGVF